MSDWSLDVASAPKDRQILMRTTRSNQVFATNWLEPTKHTPNGRFNGFSENATTMLAWCEIPAFENSEFRANAGEGASTAMRAASNDPVSRADDVRERQHASTVEIADDCRQGGNEQAAAAPVPASQFILDDVGSGA